MDAPPSGPVGQLVGHYRIEQVAGTGAFSTVYRAVDERLDDVVAVKLLADNRSLDPDIRERFLTEGRVLRRIDSPHVVRVYDLGETERHQPFLVLEHADRGTLAGRVADARRYGWRADVTDVWAVARPLATALAAVHRAQVVHRDLSPGNVLLTTRGLVEPSERSTLFATEERLMLADLGLCKDLALNSGYTAAGGTDGFRAPEVRGGLSIVGPTTDLWSLSALIVWLISGAVPPDGSVRPLVVQAGLPLDLADVLDVSLARDPARRHSDPEAWLAAIQGALRGAWTSPSGWPWPQDQVAIGASPEISGPGPSWGWRLKHSVWLLTTLLFGLTTWVGFMYIGLRANQRRWLRAAVAYGIGAAVLLAVALIAPESDSDRSSSTAWADTVGTLLMSGLWIGGFVHGLVANRAWLRWRAAYPAGTTGIPPPWEM